MLNNLGTLGLFMVHKGIAGDNISLVCTEALCNLEQNIYCIPAENNACLMKIICLSISGFVKRTDQKSNVKLVF